MGLEVKRGGEGWGWRVEGEATVGVGRRKVGGYGIGVQMGRLKGHEVKGWGKRVGGCDWRPEGEVRGWE